MRRRPYLSLISSLFHACPSRGETMEESAPFSSLAVLTRDTGLRNCIAQGNGTVVRPQDHQTAVLAALAPPVWDHGVHGFCHTWLSNAATFRGTSSPRL